MDSLTHAAMLPARIFKNFNGTKFHKIVIITDSATNIYFRFRTSSYPTLLKLEKGIHLYCLCSIIIMSAHFWNFVFLFPEHKFVYSLIPDNSMHLVLLVVSHENSELLDLPLGNYCGTSDNQPEGMTIFRKFNFKATINGFNFDHIQQIGRSCYHNLTVPMTVNAAPLQYIPVMIEQPFMNIRLKDIHHRKIRQLTVIVTQPAVIHFFYLDSQFRAYHLLPGSNVFCNCRGIIAYFSLYSDEFKFLRPKMWLELNQHRVDLILMLERRTFFRKKFQVLRMLLYQRIFLEHTFLPIFRILRTKNGIGLITQRSCNPVLLHNIF